MVGHRWIVAGVACVSLQLARADALQPSRVDAPALAIGADRQLFVDDRLVDRALTRDVTRTPNPPRDVCRVLRPERPWETLGFIFYSSVADDGRSVKLYYGSYQWDAKDAKIVRHFCLATSADGLHFERARLGRKRFGGQSVEANLLSPTAIETSVFLDPHAPAAKRYRMLYSGGSLEQPAEAGVYTATSADGIHWDKNSARLLPFIPDSQHTAYWDAGLGKYVIYMRAWDRELHKRQVCRAVVADIDRPWPYDTTVPSYFLWGKDKVPTLSRELPIVLAADEQDPANLDIYTNVVTPYPFAPGVYFAFPAVYLKFKGAEWKRLAVSGNDGNFQVQLATSADGVAWHRWRQPYVAAGFHADLNLRLVSMARGMVRRGRWIYQYFVGWPHTHGRPDAWRNDPGSVDSWMRRDLGGIYLVRQRLDGFVSLDSAYTGGVLTTRPLTFTGSRLCLNLDTQGAGSAKVALLDASGAPLPGFSAAECTILDTDDTDCVVRWKGGADVGALAGRPVRVQVAMRGTKLFALQFVDKEPETGR
jgi:predicted GH43/DUF377 family glycosyl hydrolase